MAMTASVLLGVSGCTKKPAWSYEDVNTSIEIETLDASDRSLLEKAARYWHLRSNRAFEESYMIESPAYRFTHNLERYLYESSVAPRDFKMTIRKIVHHEENPDIATVKRTFWHDGRKNEESGTWYRVNGHWYHRFYFSPFPG